MRFLRLFVYNYSLRQNVVVLNRKEVPIKQNNIISKILLVQKNAEKSHPSENLLLSLSRNEALGHH